MIRLSRRSLAKLALILLVLVLGRQAVVHREFAKEHPAPTDRSRFENSGQEPSRESAGAESSERSAKSAASAKLRSLLELRKGELGFVRLSPATMRSLLEKPDPIFRDVASEQGISVVGSVPREWMEGSLKEMVEREGSVEGVVDSSDDSFDWRLSGFEFSGSTIHLDDAVRFNIVVKNGGSGLQTLSRQRPGSMILFKMAGPQPEGVLMVVGGVPGATP